MGTIGLGSFGGRCFQMCVRPYGELETARDCWETDGLSKDCVLDEPAAFLVHCCAINRGSIISSKLAFGGNYCHT